MWAVNDAFTKSKYDVKKTKNKKHKWSQKILVELNNKATNIWIVRLTRVLHINNLYCQLRPLVPLEMIRNKNKKILPVAVQCSCISVCVLCLLTTKHNDCRTRQTFHTKSLKCGGPMTVGWEDSSRIFQSQLLRFVYQRNTETANISQTLLKC